jgi:hypothetical protein
MEAALKSQVMPAIRATSGLMSRNSSSSARFWIFARLTLGSSDNGGEAGLGGAGLRE